MRSRLSHKPGSCYCSVRVVGSLTGVPAGPSSTPADRCLFPQSVVVSSWDSKMTSRGWVLENVPQSFRKVILQTQQQQPIHSLLSARSGKGWHSGSALSSAAAARVLLWPFALWAGPHVSRLSASAGSLWSGGVCPQRIVLGNQHQ